MNNRFIERDYNTFKNDKMVFWQVYGMVVCTNSLGDDWLSKFDIYNYSSFFLNFYDQCVHDFIKFVDESLKEENLANLFVRLFLSSLFVICLVTLIPLALISLCVEAIKMTLGVILGSCAQVLEYVPGLPLDQAIHKLAYLLRFIPLIISAATAIIPVAGFFYGLPEPGSSSSSNSRKY